jgi:hypothetical protein
MSKIPQTDSVAELARFWDTHDLTEFDEELEEVKAPVFERGSENELRITLPSDDAAALHRAAESRGVDDTELVREWLTEKLHAV